jgi:RimJ/RimL family protein N-acetyltransferase
MEVLRAAAVVLRPYRIEDIDDLVSGCADPLTQEFLPALPGPYTSEDARHWVGEGAPSANAAGGWHLAVADPVNDRLTGGIGVSPRGRGTAGIGYWVMPAARGRGIATAATRLLAGHAFAYGVRRLTLGTRLDNPRSQRVAIAAGFTRECVQRASGAGRGGDRYDQLMWARLDTDPDRPGERLLPDFAAGELTDGVVSLRPLAETDAADTLALRSRPEVVRTSVPPRAPQPDEVRRACRQAEAGWLAGQRADLTIRDAATGAYAGEIGLYYTEPVTQQAMIGYSLAPGYRGHGFAARAVRLLADWCFTEVRLARLVAGTAPENVASQRVLERVGFRREGYQRGRLPGVDGTRIDDIQWALLPE